MAGKIDENQNLGFAAKPKFFGGLRAGHGWSWAGVVVQMVGRGTESREASSSQN